MAVNESYAELSGTSMAAPHVTGAAAILAQLHPDWKAEELRSALTGSSLGLPGIGVLGQGAGRVDLARALKQAVTTSPSKVDLGPVEAPHDDDKPVTKALTYRNDGDQAVTLTLELSAKGPKGRTAPAGMFKLSRSVVRIPAHGTVTLDVTADTSLPGPTARTPAGSLPPAMARSSGRLGRCRQGAADVRAEAHDSGDRRQAGGPQ